MVCCPHSNYYLAALANVINGTFREHQRYLNPCFSPLGPTLKLFISWKKGARCRSELFLWSSCVTRMRGWAAGDDSQVTLCFTGPPINFSKGGGQKETGTAHDRTLKWFPFFSFDSYSPEISVWLPPLLAYVLLYLLLGAVSLTDWLTGWPTVAPADSSYVSVPLFHLYTTLGATKGRCWPQSHEPECSFHEVGVWQISNVISACCCHEILKISKT